MANGSDAEIKLLITAVSRAGDVLVALAKDIADISKEVQSLNTQRAGVTATKDLKDLSDQSKETSDDLGKLEKKGIDLNNGMETLGKALKFVAGGFLALKSVQVLKEFGDTAARAQTLGVVLNQIGTNAGFTRRELTETDKAVQKLGITATSSRQSLAQFVQAGLPLEQAAKLARAAQDLAVIAGESSSATFSRLITNIQQLDTLGLRFVGITVDREAAERKFAIANNTTVASLTQQQKQQSLLNEVLSKAVVLQGTYEASLDTVSKKLASLDRIQETLKTSLGEGLLPAYTALVDEFSKFLVEITALSDEINQNATASERFGEIVRQLAKAVFGAIEAVIKYKDAIIFLGEALVILKLGSYIQTIGLMTRAFGLLSISTITLTGSVAAFGTALRLAFAANPLGIVITLGLALYELSERYSQVRAGIVLFSAVAVAAFQAIVLPVKVAQIAVMAFFAAIEAISKGKNPITAAAEVTKKGFADIRAAALENAAVIKASAKDMVSSQEGTAQATKKSLEELIPAYRTQQEEIKKLIALYDQQKEAGNKAAADLTLGQINAANSTLKLMDRQIAARIATGQLTDAEKALADAFDSPKQQAALGAKALEDYTKKLDAANASLKTSETTVRDGKVFSSQSLKDVEAFKLIYVDALNKVKAGTLSSADAAVTLRVALRNIISGTKTQDDLKEITKLFADTRGSIIDLTGVVNSVSPDIAAQQKSIRDSENAKAKQVIAERKATLKAAQAVELASLEAQQAREVAAISASLASIDNAYKLGKVSVKDYYASKRQVIEQETALETEVLKKKLANTNKEIASAKSDKLTKAEVNNLVAIRIGLESQLAAASEDRSKKLQEISFAERADLEAFNILAEKTYADLLTAQGRVFDARKIALKQEQDSRIKAVQGSDPESEATKQNIRDITALKQLQVTTDERMASVARDKMSLDSEEANIQNLNSRNLLTRADYEENIRRIYAERLVLAERELIILRDSDPAGTNMEIQNSILNKQREIGNLQTKNLTLFREYADSINNTLKSSTTSFFEDLSSGTVTFEQAFKKMILNITNELAKLAASNITKTLFAGTDIGGAVTGQSESGGVGDQIKKIGSNIGSAFGFGGSQTDQSQQTADQAAEGVGKVFDAMGEKTNTASQSLAQQLLGSESGIGKLFSSLQSGFGDLFDSLSGLVSDVLGSLSGGSSGGTGGIIKGITSFFGFAEGGLIQGAGTGTSDSIPIAASNGEYVVKARSTAKYLPLLHAINEDSNSSVMRIPRTPFFAEGGLVTDLAASEPQKGNGGKAQTTRIVNVIDPAMAGEYLNSPAGEKVILNVLRRNKGGVTNSQR